VKGAAIIQPDDTAVLGEGDTDAFTFRNGAHDIILDGFTIDFTKRKKGGVFGVVIMEGSQNITIQNNEIMNALSQVGVGIYSGANGTTPISGHNYLRNNKIHDFPSFSQPWA
jgi:hypothetical protein